MTIAAPTATQLLDLDIRVRAESVRFDVLDQVNTKIGEVDVEQENPPAVANDITRPIRRTLEGLIISPAMVADIDPFTMRLRPMWEIPAASYEDALGVFVFTAQTLEAHSYGYESPVTLSDQSLILNQKLTINLNFAAGTNIGTALTVVAAIYGITNVSIDSTTRVLTTPATWAAGRDTGITVMESLAVLGGYAGPFFDRTGVLCVSQATDPAFAAPTVPAYGADTRVIDGTVDFGTVALTAPNRYIATDTSATASPVTAYFDIPATAPNSIANRGFAIVGDPIEAQGFPDAAAALDACKAAYAADASAYQSLSFDSTPDPRHDTFDYYYFDSVLYRELSWRLPLVAGGRMSHDARALL